MKGVSAPPSSHLCEFIVFLTVELMNKLGTLNRNCDLLKRLLDDAAEDLLLRSLKIEAD